jgi:DNA repair protein RadC
MKKMHDIEEHDRPREKIRKKGASCLSNQELIAAILGSGSPGRNVRVLAKEISDIIDKNPDAVQYQDFALVKGMGSAKTSQIIACLELARRFYSGDTTTPKISTPADILPHVSFLSGKKQEHFICITLNGANEVIHTRTITMGLLNHSLVHPREVFADAITDRAASIICVHNHPSGTLDPSSQDVAITRQLADAGTLVGIRLLDHVIITDSGWLSMKEQGLI